jgi:hypothetical protein
MKVSVYVINTSDGSFVGTLSPGSCSKSIVAIFEFLFSSSEIIPSSIISLSEDLVKLNYFLAKQKFEKRRISMKNDSSLI